MFQLPRNSLGTGILVHRIWASREWEERRCRGGVHAGRVGQVRVVGGEAWVVWELSTELVALRRIEDEQRTETVGEVC